MFSVQNNSSCIQAILVQGDFLKNESTLSILHQIQLPVPLIWLDSVSMISSVLHVQNRILKGVIDANSSQSTFWNFADWTHQSGQHMVDLLVPILENISITVAETMTIQLSLQHIHL